MAQNFIFTVDFMEHRRKIRVESFQQLRDGITKHFKDAKFFKSSFRLQALDEDIDELIDVVDMSDIGSYRNLVVSVDDLFEDQVPIIENSHEEQNLTLSEQPENDRVINNEENDTNTIASLALPWPHPFVIKDRMLMSSIITSLDSKEVLSKSKLSMLLTGLYDECQRLNIKTPGSPKCKTSLKTLDGGKERGKENLK